MKESKIMAFKIYNNLNFNKKIINSNKCNSPPHLLKLLNKVMKKINSSINRYLVPLNNH